MTFGQPGYLYLLMILLPLLLVFYWVAGRWVKQRLARALNAFGSFAHAGCCGRRVEKLHRQRAAGQAR